MWDCDSVQKIGSLDVRNFVSKTPFPWVGTRLPRHAQALLLRSKIPDELMRVRPSIVHLQNPGPPFEFLRIARMCKKLGMKVVASTHGFYEIFNPNYGLSRFQAAVWPWAITKPIAKSLKYIDAFVSGYPNEKGLLMEHGVLHEKIHLVPNGINPFFQEEPTFDEIESAKDKFRFNQDNPILLYMGNHTANKGIDTVIRMASQLKRPVTLMIGGKVRNPESLGLWQSMIPDGSLLKLIVTDYLSHEEQRVLYHISNALIFPSMADTLPLTILEAMACGLPVVAYDTGGIGFQLDEDSGVVVPQGDEQILLEETDRLLQSPERQKRLSANALKRQRQLFTWESAALKTIAVYEQLLRLTPELRA